ncbi:MAG: putative bifunctional diguanylate cyclase/phosphodiesterase [Sulfuriferula sp.]
MLFGKDRAIGSMLPALGLPQTLRQGSGWGVFVEMCQAQAGSLYEQSTDQGCLQGIADIHGHCVLAVRGHLPAGDIQLIALLLRPLGMKFVEERQLQGLQSDMRSAREIAQHAEALNKTIDTSRTLLRAAYQRAESELVQRRSTEAQLMAATELSQALMHYSVDIIALFDDEGRVMEISNSVTNIWGYHPEEIIGRIVFDYIVPDDVQRSYAAMQSLAPHQPVIDFENRYRRKDGGIVHMLWNATKFDGKGRFIGLARDITALKRVSIRLEESEQRFRSLFDHHTDAVLARDLDGRFIEGNRALMRLTQYSAAELQQLSTRTLATTDEQQRNRAHFQQAVQGVPQNFRTKIQRKDGSTIEVDLAYVPTIVKQKVVGVFGIMRDITEAMSYERHISYLASHDALTGLPNRNLLEERMRHAIEQRNAEPFGILFMDLNRFKIVNDSLGHDKGDQLLRMIADRLRTAVREGDTVARLGGDEFVVVLEDIQSSGRVAQVANQLLIAVAKPFQLDGHELTISTSIGASIYPKNGTDAATLLKHADLAMYQAKELGTGTFRFFDPVMNVKLLERLLTETGLQRALERNELVLHYQPRIDMNQGVATGVEALVRWMHPERGLIAPEDFIPLAEEIGMIGAVGEWVLETACRQNRNWQNAGQSPLKMSVNLSAHQLREPKFIVALRRILDDTGLDPRWLELEITETSLMQDLETSLATLQEIRQIGVSISIDDFGTGYSSLAYLKKLPIDTLKIDKSFIHDVINDQDDAAIVTATISLAHNMGLQVVAEGVTTPDQVRFLLDRQCSAMQGYLFSRPVPAAELVESLENCMRRTDIEQQTFASL